MSGRTTLKTYFLSGSSPSEANFADLIDSVLVLSEDLTDSISTSSSTIALSANAGNSLNNLISALDSRVVTLEGADNSFASNYYNKTEVDATISTINGLFNTLPYTGQIASIDAEILSIKSSITGLSLSTHSHNISDIAGLQSAIDAKATTTYVDNIAALLTQSINAIVPSDETAEVAQLQLYIDAINSVLSGLPDFSTKSDVGHTHSVANITDLTSVYYSKIQVDALFENVAPGAHNHTESEITDLDKYTQGAVDLKLTDHNNLKNNPHAVTKDQLGLGSVENLSVIDLFQTPQAQAFATDAELQEVNAINIDHVASTSNPHSVTKQQVNLGNVPNINFQSLLDAHLADSNPHKIDLTYFDVFSRAETDSRVVHYIDSLRYAFKPTTPADGAGAIGDIAYHDSGLYFKFGATDWRQVISSKAFNDGSAGSKFLIETPKLEVTTPGGDNLFSADSSGLSVGIDVSIDGKLTVIGHTSISSLAATTATVNSLDSGSGVIQTTGQLKGGATSVSSLASAGKISGTDLTLSGNLTVNGTTTSIDTTNLLIEDNMVVLNKNQTGTPPSTLDSGIEVERGDGENTSVYWDEATDEWKINSGGTITTIENKEYVEELFGSTSSAAVSAAAALVSENNASASESTASSKAGEASGSAENASTYASTASSKAGEALSSAENASTYASNASGSATASSNSATASANSASTASTKATASSNSATASKSAEDASISAKNASVSAKNASETARNESVSAKNTAVSNATSASNSASTASTKATAASNSASASAGSASTASTKATQASASATSASSSASTASTKANASAASATASANSATASQAALTAAKALNYTDGVDGTTPTFTYDEDTKTLAIKNS